MLIGGAPVLAAFAVCAFGGVVGGAACATVVCVRRLRQQVARLEALADADPLTGLVNRRALERLDQLPGTAGWVAYVDIDRFKCVNDHHGHLAGDLLLRVVANLLRTSVRPGDVVARVGGDEFIVVLGNCTRHEALAVVTRVQTNLSSGVHGCTLSIGLSAVPALAAAGRGTSFGGAVGAADAALGAAKRLGRGSVVVASGAGFTRAVGSGAGRGPQR